VLLELSHATGLTTRAAISDEGYPVFIERVDSPGVIRFHTPLGVRELPHTSAAGKAILAELPAAVTERVAAETDLPQRTPNTIRTLPALLAELDGVRERGFAVDDEEDALGVMCVAAAFFDHTGQVAGALSATGISRDIGARGLDALGGDVRAAAGRVTALLGGADRSDDGGTA
jgi:IclR family acetate operon transcriptional repressor